MKIKKEYTAVIIRTDDVNKTVRIKLSYGEIEGPYYDQERPTETFDTEDEAIAYAFKKDPYGSWLILPIISFDNH